MRPIEADPALEIARLEARVAALEAALERRSEELRRLQRGLSRRELVNLTRVVEGLPPLPKGTYDIDLWTESTDLTEAQVEETLHDLWSGLPAPNLTAAPATPPTTSPTLPRAVPPAR